MKYAVAVLSLLATSSVATATSITLKFPGETGVTEILPQISYTCGDGQKIVAKYINVPGNSLAMLTIGSGTVLTVSVLAGSGVKYVGGKYVWWTKGPEADLYDVTNGENAPGTHCTEAK
jgi:membrane-bound inhibitor of C-type lysozyme